MLPECFLVMVLITGELYGWATLSEEQDRYTIFRATDVPVMSSGQWVEFDSALKKMKIQPLRRSCVEVRQAVEARWNVRVQTIEDPADVPRGLWNAALPPDDGPP